MSKNFILRNNAKVRQNKPFGQKKLLNLAYFAEISEKHLRNVLKHLKPS